MKQLFLILFYCVFSIAYSQNSIILFSKLKIAKTDTQKITLLNTLTKFYIDKSNLDSADAINSQSFLLVNKASNKIYGYKSYYYKAIILRKKKKYDDAFAVINQGLDIAKHTKNKSDEASALNAIGTIYDVQNKNDLALDFFLKALEINKQFGVERDLVSNHLSLGIYYKKMGKLTDALSHLLPALKIAEKIKDSTIIFTSCINLGSLYEKTNDKPKAKDFYKKALIITQADHNESDQAIVYYKLGKLFHSLHNIDSAKFYLLNTLKIHAKLKDDAGLIGDYSNLGGFAVDDKNYHEAEMNYLKALELALNQNDTVRINMIYSYLGKVNSLQGKTQNSIKFYEKSLIYVNSIVPKETVESIYRYLAFEYAKVGNYKSAYHYHLKHKTLTDSIYNLIETKKQTELKLNYEFEKAQKKIEEETTAKEILSQAEIEKQKLQRNYLLFGFIIISGLLIFTIKNYRAKQKANVLLHKQKKEIEHQKKLVDEKNTEINDSINYALRIQTATIPKADEINNWFKNYKLLFKPKDVVSGDFYWASNTQDVSLIAVADCTGHGVPGAITSMMGSMLLNEIFYVKQIFEPNKVLTELNRLVKITLRQEEDALSNDGMDIAFCMLNTTTNVLHYAGANRPIYVLSAANNLVEYKPTKFSIGGQIALIQEYDLHEIQLNVGDTVIMTTDGYADQFGGENEKKYTTKKFKNIISTLANNEPQTIINVLDIEHVTWKGKCDQTDDVLVFVFKV